MGTKSQTLELQRKIKEIIAQLGWTQNRLAREIYTETHEVDDADEIKSFQERLKKELQRDTTKPEKLKRYISIIYQSPEAQKLDVALNKYVPSGYIGDSISKKMKMISAEVDKAIGKARQGRRH